MSEARIINLIKLNILFNACRSFAWLKIGEVQPRLTGAFVVFPEKKMLEKPYLVLHNEFSVSKKHFNQPNLAYSPR